MNDPFPKHQLYCRLCWQHFDRPSQHGKGSYLGAERLNGRCPGDIHATEYMIMANQAPAEKEPSLKFDAAEPIKI